MVSDLLVGFHGVFRSNGFIFPILTYESERTQPSKHIPKPQIHKCVFFSIIGVLCWLGDSARGRLNISFCMRRKVRRAPLNGFVVFCNSSHFSRL